MKRRIGIVGIGFAVVLVGAQMIQPKLLDRFVSSSHDLLQDPSLDPQVRAILMRSCADCHSNTAKLPWYGRISPVSWLIARHMQQGREKLNFSEWPLHSENIRQDIADSIDKNEMPMESYLFIHRDAQLTPHDRKTLEAWADAH